MKLVRPPSRLTGMMSIFPAALSVACTAENGGLEDEFLMCDWCVYKRAKDQDYVKVKAKVNVHS